MSIEMNKYKDNIKPVVYRVQSEELMEYNEISLENSLNEQSLDDSLSNHSNALATTREPSDMR